MKRHVLQITPKRESCHRLERKSRIRSNLVVFDRAHRKTILKMGSLERFHSQCGQVSSTHFENAIAA